jgi:transposase
LDGRFQLLLVNPRHVEQVPGRKSDVSDAEGIARLLQCGLLRGSFVPRRERRELRDLTRFPAQLTPEQTRLADRIHKVLEDANIKLGAVASDILGKSGRAMRHALIRGELAPEKLAELAEGRLRAKIPELKLALEGYFTEHIGSWWSTCWATWTNWSGTSRRSAAGSASGSVPCWTRRG